MQQQQKQKQQFLILLLLVGAQTALLRGRPQRQSSSLDVNGWPTDRDTARRTLRELSNTYNGRLQLHDTLSTAIHGCFIVRMNCPPSSNAEVTPECLSTRDAFVSQITSNDNNDGYSSAVFSASISFRYNASLDGFAGCFSPSALEAILSNPEVVTVEEDLQVTTQVSQDDPVWGLDRIDQELLQPDNKYDTGDVNGAGVDVFIIDTGINTQHSEYAGRVAGGADFVNDGNGYDDCNGHGTHCAGTAVGSTYGVAKQADLYGVRVLGCGGSGTLSGVLAGLDWAVSKKMETGKPSVASMSLGASYSTSMNAGVAAATAAGVVVVAAAGNENSDACFSSPASETSAITVGSTTSTDARSSFSNWGTCVDIFAPGSYIKSAWIGSSTATSTISGTSMATPHVAGAVALELELMASEGAMALRLRRKVRKLQDVGTSASSLVSEVTNRLLARATQNQISDTGTGSPNLLLRTPNHAFGPTPPPAPTTPPTTPPTAPPSPPTAAPTSTLQELEMRITTKAWGYECQWAVDGAVPTHEPYSDHSYYTHALPLTPGTHTIQLSDTYGDGWHGGHWELVYALTGERVLCVDGATNTTFDCSGPTLGQVTGYGETVTLQVGAAATEPPTAAPTTQSPTPFPTLASTNFPTPAPTSQPTTQSPTPFPTFASTSFPSLFPTPSPTAPQTSAPNVEVRIRTKEGGSEVYWGVDTPKLAHINPRQYGPYADNRTYVHRLFLTPGQSHQLKVMDSFGDGWGRNAFWELIEVSSGTRIAGGPAEGTVAGFGATVSFSV